eukprot:3583077-Prorocentrum_lima.AAC.1
MLVRTSRRPSWPHPRLYRGFVVRPTGAAAAKAPRRPNLPCQRRGRRARYASGPCCRHARR